MLKNILKEKNIWQRYNELLEVKDSIKEIYQDGKLIKNQIYLEVFSDRKTAIIFNVAKWKRKYLASFLPEYRLIFLKNDFNLKIVEIIIKLFKNTEFIVWGRSITPALSYISNQHNIKINHIEDGFIRSVGLGSNHILGYSLCFDQTGIYYDSRSPSDLENMLNTYDFTNKKDLIKKAKSIIKDITSNGISKYNLLDKNKVDIEKLYGLKTKKRILVIGQVENDQSLIYGCDVIMSNLEFIEKVILENPDSQIIYKPHPDVISGKRRELSNFDSIQDRIEILTVDVPLSTSLGSVDQVYTMTSLAGFEALLYGIPVTTFGAPFYSNWGLTDDRQIVERRKRNLKLEELFAVAYILYPRYISDDYITQVGIDQVIENIKKNKALSIIDEDIRDASSPVVFYNLHSKHPVDHEYINYSKNQKKIIISSHTNIHKIVNRINSDNVDIVFLSEKLANDPLFYVNPNFSNFSISSITKKYSAPFSDLETRCIEDSKIFGNVLLRILKPIINGLISDSALSELVQGIEDYLYNDIVKFHTYNEILKEYDQIYLDLNNYESNFDTIVGLIYHAENENCLNKISLSFEDKNSARNLVKNHVIKKLKITDLNCDGDIFRKLYWDILQNLNSQFRKSNIVVCGNIAGKNYAYAPSTIKLLKTLHTKESIDDIIFINSSLFNESQFEECKKYIFEENLANKISIYDGIPSIYKENYKGIFEELESFLTGDFYSCYISELMYQLPEKLILILKDRIISFLKNLTSQFILLAEISKILENSRCFYTTMERSPISRAICTLFNEKDINTVGIQPQVISTSSRYKKFIVNKMGVIDSNQSGIYKSLGSTNQFVHVGSVNIFERLQLLENYHQHVGKNDDFTIFFAMQHSLKSEMEFIFESLTYILKQNISVKVFIKPHPHQEKPLINRVSELFGNSPEVTILNPSADTYEYIAKSKVVLGVFSSVLLEAGIFGIPVIVMHQNPINDSINFSKLGLGVEVTDQKQLLRVLYDFQNQGKYWKDLRSSQKNYLAKNNQFLAPYNAHILEKFILEGVC